MQSMQCFCLNCYTYRHNSESWELLLLVVKKLYCDLPMFYSVEIFTAAAVRPNLIVVDRKSNMFIIKLTVGHGFTAK